MWWLAVACVVVIGGALWGPIVSNVEKPKYTVVDTDHSFEIRDYPAMIVAEVEVSGARKQAIGKGFRVIADYVFGDNLSSQKVAMTAPVTQQAEGKFWQVRFIMPASYTMQTLPKPKNPDVKLKAFVGKRFAVMRFSGLAGNDSLKSHTDELDEFLNAKKLTALTAPTFAFYNPPWTVPFMRRNEVMIEVAR